MATNTEWWGQDILPRIQWRVRVAEGEEIPSGYGLAYYEPGFARAVAMPLPLNLIVGGWRALVWWLKCPPWRHVEWLAEKHRELAWDEGFNAAQTAYWSKRMFQRINPYRRKR